LDRMPSLFHDSFFSRKFPKKSTKYLTPHVSIYTRMLGETCSRRYSNANDRAAVAML